MAGWDGVPWFTGGVAEHSDELARLLAYASSQGSNGVVGPNDLVVRQQEVANGTIRVLPGACFIRARHAGGQYQSYAARLPTQDTPITVPPTSSAGPRTDLVIVRVENPNAPGEPWQQPATPKVGPYIFTRIVTGVPAGTTDLRQISARAADSAITLARITQPASNSIITQAMITSLRDMAMPRSRRTMLAKGVIQAEAETLDSVNPEGEAWPNLTALQWRIDVPEWATRVRIRAEWAQVAVPPGIVIGHLWARLGADTNTARIETQRVAYVTPGSTNHQRSTFAVADDLAVPAGLRGLNHPVWLKGRVQSVPQGIAPGNLIRLDAGSAVSLDLDFLESPAEDAT